MNLLSKKTPWVAASLLAAASVFAQQGGRQQQKQMFDQGHELSQSQMMAAYNAPARIEVRGAWDFYVQGAFTYWQASQENMELGMVNDSSVTGFNGAAALNANVVNMDFGFKPGFKVGLGMNFDPDNWDGLVQYTWYRGTNSTKTILDPTNADVTLRPIGLHPQDAVSDSFHSGSERWRLAMDLLDLELARSEYRGMKLTVRPFIGARGAWIRQRLSQTFTRPISGDQTTLDVATVTQKSQSWALGPRAGVSSNWMVGQGFRFYGVGTGDILYTRYTTLGYNQVTTQDGDATANSIQVRQKKLGYLRPHLELELGLGWGTYFDNNNWHVDLAAGYGFQVFFNQNMFRYFVDEQNRAQSFVPNGNLYVQGLTATVRFDF